MTHATQLTGQEKELINCIPNTCRSDRRQCGIRRGGSRG